MRVSVFGGGPAGICMAYHLAKRGERVTLYERYDKLGGCWAVHRHEELFTEHAPRRFFDNYTNTIHFFKEIGIDYKKEFKKHESILFQTLKHSISLPLTDLLKLFSSMFVSHANETMEEYMKRRKIKSKRYITDLCYHFDGVGPEKFLVSEFFEILNCFTLYNSYTIRRSGDVGLWKIAEQKLKEVGVTIQYNTGFRWVDRHMCWTTKGYVRSDRFYLCFPPESEPNYTSYAVQFHFDVVLKNIDITYETYGPKHVVFDHYTHEGYSIISACSMIESTTEEIWEAIKSAHPHIPDPYKRTVSPEKHIAYLRNERGFVKTKISDTMYTIGAHTFRKFPATSIEASIESAYRHLGIPTQRPFTLVGITYVFLVIILLRVYSNVH
jgi:hypothetical protein